MVVAAAVGGFADRTVYMCSCVQLLRPDGTLIAACDWSSPVIFDLGNGNGSVTHSHKPGFKRNAVEMSPGINPDVGSVLGALSSDLITPEDIAAGLYSGSKIWGAFVEVGGSAVRPWGFYFLQNILQEDDKYTANLVDIRALLQNRIVSIINAEPDEEEVLAGIEQGPGYVIPGLDRMLEYPPTGQTDEE